MEIRVWLDITSLEVDAIVNAANNSLMRGGGVCGAIFRAAGPRLDEACDAIGWCDSGDAAATDAFDLPARSIIHTVGPVWEGGDFGEVVQLADCYRSVLRVADEIDASTLAIPAISTGIYAFPPDQAARIAVDTLQNTATRVRHVVLVAFDDDTESQYRSLLAPRD